MNKEESECLKRRPLKRPFYGADMSLGVNVLNAVVGQIPKSFHYDVEIVETHHAHKKDAPAARPCGSLKRCGRARSETG